MGNGGKDLSRKDAGETIVVPIFTLASCRIINEIGELTSIDLGVIHVVRFLKRECSTRRSAQLY